MSYDQLRQMADQLRAAALRLRRVALHTDTMLNRVEKQLRDLPSETPQRDTIRIRVPQGDDREEHF